MPPLHAGRGSRQQLSDRRVCTAALVHRKRGRCRRQQQGRMAGKHEFVRSPVRLLKSGRRGPHTKTLLRVEQCSVHCRGGRSRVGDALTVSTGFLPCPHFVWLLVLLGWNELLPRLARLATLVAIRRKNRAGGGFAPPLPAEGVAVRAVGLGSIPGPQASAVRNEAGAPPPGRCSPTGRDWTRRCGPPMPPAVGWLASAWHHSIAAH